VTFAYGREVGGVESIDLVIEPGQKLGIVGASGRGNRRSCRFLLRLYDTEGGRLTLDGTDIRTSRRTACATRSRWSRRKPRCSIARRWRTSATVAPTPRDEEVFAAARRAEAHDFILKRCAITGAHGYEAHLGERGVKLSGGQRQRIALARAFLKDAPVLVLDEATSALDSEVEAAIQSTLTDIMEGKTVIAIAHRLSTLAAMDRIIVLDAGRIVEDGTHEDLLARNGGLYARYWNRQSGGFIGADMAAAE
jgi:ATP-binding cassette subfamily B protein